MNIPPIVLCLITALGFGIWPIIARFANANTGWIGIFVNTATGLMTALALSGQAPPKRSIGILIVAGIVNGLGFLAYAQLLSTPKLELSRTLPMAVALIPVFTAVAAMIVFKEPVTARKAAGILLAFVAVFLLSEKTTP